MSDQPMFLGVDGGGTRCRARLTDARGATIGEGLGGPANARRGVEAAMAEIETAARAALAAAGLPADALDRLSVGAGLAGLCQPDELAAMRALPHPFASLSLTSDFAIACLGAHDGGDGGIVIAGTGSVAYGRREGEEFRFGGWGFEASDEGGGAPLGREALRHSLRAADGMATAGPLASAVLKAVGGDQEAAVAWVGRAGPSDFGTLAPLVFANADADPAASALLDATAMRIGELVMRLGACGITRVALAGGMAAPLTPRLPADAAALIVPAQAEPVDGAIALARGAAR